MEAGEILKAVFKRLGFPASRLYFDTCGGKKEKPETYFTYQLIWSNGTAFADDDNTATQSTWRLDLYTKSDYTKLLSKLIAALKEADFFGITVEGEMYEADTRYYHVPLQIKYLMEE